MSKDWKCPKCGGINPEKRNTCLGCNTQNICMVNPSENNETTIMTILNKLIKELTNPDKSVREAAAKELGKIGDPRAVEPLIAAIKSRFLEKESVRKAIVMALGQIGNERAVKYLIQTLENEYEWDVHEVIVKALCRIDDARVVEPLVAIQRDTWDKSLFNEAAKALRKLKDPRAAEPLNTFDNDRKQDVALVIPEALPNIGPSSKIGSGFSKIGSMTTIRAIHNATLLADGRVLITGGGFTGTPPEVYDPVSNTFNINHLSAFDGTKKYDLDFNVSNHIKHTTTLLPDGQILLFAELPGWDRCSFLFNPRTNTCHLLSKKRALDRVVYDHTATLLPSGYVLIIGADGFGTAELFDPKGNIFIYTKGMNLHHDGGFTATLLSDGQVLIAGGWAEYADNPSSSVSMAELFDLGTDAKFTPTGSMTIGRGAANAILLSDGRVLIIGGVGTREGVYPNNRPQQVASTDLYDPKTGTFTESSAMNVVRRRHTTTLLPDGHILITGGIEGNYDYKALDSAELYDPETDTFRLINPMTTPRYGHTATLLLDGRVLITGGNDGSKRLASAEVYQP